jgi:microsomal dipeptidase-like Zn-dependent dipeptidase
MHLIPEDEHPHEHSKGWFRRLRDLVEAELVDLAARAIGNASWDGGWRIDLDGLAAGEARLVCSVLYWPADEFDLDNPHPNAPPEPGYFQDIKHQLTYVENQLASQDPDGRRHRIAKRGDTLEDDGRVTFVHCVEGGFHLGPDLDAIDDHVKWLADNGVVYITVAHLFYRGVAGSAPAIPAFSDEEYTRVFHAPSGPGLTAIGERLVRAMYKHDVLVDVSHMRQDAIDATFALVEELDAEHGKNPPIIATHVGSRDVVGDQSYNLSDATIKRIADRGGVVGMILAQHQMGETARPEDSKAVLKKHADAIAAAAGGHHCTAIGSDLDGFIKPTLAGIDRAPDLATLAGWIRELYPDDADAILHGNAHRVLSSALA